MYAFNLALPSTAQTLGKTIKEKAVPILRYIVCAPHKLTKKAQLNPYQIAYLKGKEKRVLELGLTRLVDQGYLLPNLRNQTFSIQKILSSDTYPLEKQVMQQVSKTPDLKHLKQVHHYSMKFITIELSQAKLIISGWAIAIRRSAQFVFYGLALSLIFSACIADKSHTYSNEVVIAWFSCLMLTLPTTLTTHRTQWGNYLLNDVEKHLDSYDATQSVALYGYEVLSGGELDTLKQMFQKEKEDEDAEKQGACGCGC